MNESKYKNIAEELCDWYGLNQRDLPWRMTKEPYRIWISEIMAQQTRISALIPYYQRFVERFPSVVDLAEADIEEVLAMWAGLGYYSRAHNLHKAAQMLLKEYGGIFPQEIKTIRSLPGIGEYTAGAISSISYGKPEPAVDGNVKRVYARLMLDETEVGSKEMKGNATAFVSQLMPHAEPAVLTQSLMELGALICTPKNPDCKRCPLIEMCIANFEGRQPELPKRKEKIDKKVEKKTILWVRNPFGEVLLKKRTEKLLHGMHQYVLLDGHPGEDNICEKLAEMGLESENPFNIKGYRHTFTHLIWEMKGYCCEVKGQLLDETSEGYQFYNDEERSKMAIPRAFIWVEKQNKECK